MESWERRLLILELRDITRPYVLKTDEEAFRDRARAREICRAFRCDYPEDVFEDFGRYA